MPKLFVPESYPEGILGLSDGDFLMHASSLQSPKELHVLVHGTATIVAGYLALQPDERFPAENLLMIGASDVFDEAQTDDQIAIVEAMPELFKVSSGLLRVLNVVDHDLFAADIMCATMAQRAKFMKLEDRVPGVKVGFTTRWAAGLEVRVRQQDTDLTTLDRGIYSAV